MSEQRPINLNLLTIRMPITAFVSIGHRLSGLLLFFSVPLLLYSLDMSLKTEENFHAIVTLAAEPISQLVLWVIGLGFIWHVLAGLKHLLMDCHIGESRCTATAFSWLVILLFLVLAAGSAYLLWWR